MSQHHSPGGVFHCVAAWGGVGARAGACQSVAIFHQSVGGMAGPADRPASGAHFVPGPGCHRSPAPLTVRSAPARRHASSASSRATTILPVGRRCSCPACSGSPSWWPGCRGLPVWPPCAGEPAGAIWPVAGRNRPHRYSSSALKAGRRGWSTSSTGDMPGHLGSGSWEYIKPGSSCAGPPAIAWPTGRASVPPGRSPGANVPKTIARSGTLAAVNIARPTSWRSRYEPGAIPKPTGSCGWWFLVPARAVLPGTF